MTYTHLTTDELVMIEAYYRQYKKNKARCGRRQIVLPDEQQVYITEKVAQGWTPDVIIGRQEMPIACSMRTLYRRFKEKVFDETTLPMKGKRKPNGHQERRGKQAFKRNIAERENSVMSKAIPLSVFITKVPS